MPIYEKNPLIYIQPVHPDCVFNRKHSGQWEKMSAVTVFVVACAEQLTLTIEVGAFYLSGGLGCGGFGSITLSCHGLLA